MSAAPLSVVAEDGGVSVTGSGGAVEATGGNGTGGTDGESGTDGSDGHDRGVPRDGDLPSPWGTRGARDGSDGTSSGPGENGGDGGAGESGTDGTPPSDEPTGGEDGSGTDATPDGGHGSSPNTTGNQTASSTGDTSITTGDATAVTDVTTKGNVNITDTESDPALGGGSGSGVADTEEGVGEGVEGGGGEGGENTRDDRRETKVLDKRPRDYATTTTLETVVESENDITVENQGETAATSGLNNAGGSGEVNIATGDTTAFANILNAVNVNVVNSSGIMLFLNSIFGSLGTLDLRGAFSGESDGALIGSGIFGETDPSIGICTFTSCAGDVTTRIFASSTARLTNDVIVRSIAGQNSATSSGALARIESGDALAGANVVNVANTNIVNSNYLLLAFNAFGDWLGDLVFPNGDFFKRLLGGGAGEGGGSSDVVDGEAPLDSIVASTTIASDNTSAVGNDLGVDAETGNNAATSTGGQARIETGSSAALGQVMNRLNQNIVGGNSMLVLLQIHGSWAGDLFNVPEGILWEKTPGGVAIWNDPNYHGSGAAAAGAVGATSGGGSAEGADGDAASGGLEALEDAFVPLSELTVSERGDRDARRAARDAEHDERRGTTTTEILHQNIAEIANSVKVLALTGENRAFSGGGDALITSGNAFAAANILNIANTNVIGANWVLAMVNIFGDWSGSLSFGEPDLWIGTAVEAPRSPLEAGDELTYHFTVANHGDARASNVWLRASALGDLLVFDPIFLDTRGDARLFVGSLAPGEVRELTLAGRLDTPLPFGTHTIDHTFTLTSYEPETNRADNTETLSLLAYGGEALVSESGGSDAGRGGGGGSSSGGGSGDVGGGGSSGSSGENASGGGTADSGSTTGGSESGGGENTSSGGSNQSAGNSGGSSGGSSSTSGGGGGGGGIYYTSPANLAIAKRNSATAPVPAGSSVDYTVVIKNDGLGEAYHAVLVDVLKDAGGAVIHEERWNLETIYPAEEVTVTYTIEFSADAAAGTYTNSAYVKAYDGHPSLDPFYGSAADSPTVTSTVEIVGTSSSSGGGAQSGGAAAGTSANSQSNVPSSPATPPGSGVLQTHNETATSATAATAATSSSLTVAGGTGTTSASSLAVAGQQSIVEIGAGARAFTPSLPAPVTHVVAARGIAEAPRGAIAFDERGTPASESGTPFALSDGSDTLSGDLRDEAAQYPLVQAGDSAETDVSPLSGLAPWRQGAIAGLTHAAAAFLSGLPIPSAILLPLFLVILLLVGAFLVLRPARAG